MNRNRSLIQAVLNENRKGRRARLCHSQCQIDTRSHIQAVLNGRGLRQHVGRSFRADTRFPDQGTVQPSATLTNSVLAVSTENRLQQYSLLWDRSVPTPVVRPWVRNMLQSSKNTEFSGNGAQHPTITSGSTSLTGLPTRQWVLNHARRGGCGAQRTRAERPTTNCGPTCPHQRGAGPLSGVVSYPLSPHSSGGGVQH